jgi:hypothetical protein
MVRQTLDKKVKDSPREKLLAYPMNIHRIHDVPASRPTMVIESDPVVLQTMDMKV